LLGKIVIVAGILFLSILILYVSSPYFVGFVRPTPDFDMSVNPQIVILEGYKGSSKQAIITLGSINGFDENVSLSITKGFGMIGGVRVNLDSYQVHVQENVQVQVKLSFYVISAISPGNYHVDVFANSSDISHSVRVIINVPDQIS
jgi:hypothetical protein